MVDVSWALVLATVQIKSGVGAAFVLAVHTGGTGALVLATKQPGGGALVLASLQAGAVSLASASCIISSLISNDITVSRIDWSACVRPAGLNIHRTVLPPQASVTPRDQRTACTHPLANRVPPPAAQRQHRRETMSRVRPPRLGDPAASRAQPARRATLPAAATPRRRWSDNAPGTHTRRPRRRSRDRLRRHQIPTCARRCDRPGHRRPDRASLAPLRSTATPSPLSRCTTQAYTLAAIRRRASTATARHARAARHAMPAPT